MIKAIRHGRGVAVETKGKGYEVFIELIAVMREIKNLVAKEYGEQKARKVMNAIFKAAMDETTIDEGDGADK